MLISTLIVLTTFFSMATSAPTCRKGKGRHRHPKRPRPSTVSGDNAVTTTSVSQVTIKPTTTLVTVKPSTTTTPVTIKPTTTSTPVTIKPTTTLVTIKPSTTPATTTPATTTSDPPVVPTSSVVTTPPVTDDSSNTGSVPTTFVNQWDTTEDGLTVLDKTFGTFPEASECPDDSRGPCYKHVYPEGKLSDGDMLNFYTAGPEGFDTTNAKEVLFTFQVWFNDDFDFVKGGKLPGLYGGTSTTGGKSCSGGDQRDDCFSARGMWRTDGAGELYNYFPFEQNYCNTPDSGNGVVTVCESGGYGASVDRGAFTFPKGKWVSLAQRLKLNDPGQANGEQELFVDGVSKIKHTDVQIRGTDDVRIQGVMAQSFFGGSKDEFRPPKDETAYFTGYAYGIISTF